MSALEESDKSYAEGATAPRISLDFMKSEISSVHYMDGGTFMKSATWSDWSDKASARPDLQHSTVCMMVMKSGFVVIGHSAPISAGNYQPERGRELAYENCIRQLWPLFAFAFKVGDKAIRSLMA